jgi:hypothetical protein
VCSKYLKLFFYVCELKYILIFIFLLLKTVLHHVGTGCLSGLCVQLDKQRDGDYVDAVMDDISCSLSYCSLMVDVIYSVDVQKRIVTLTNRNTYNSSVTGTFTNIKVLFIIQLT